MHYFTISTQITSSYNLSNSDMHAPASVMDLGVTIDKDLTYNTHINNIVHHADYHAYLNNKCFVSRDRSTLFRAFTTYVLSLA